MEIKVCNWGITKENETVLSYTLKNDFLEIEILNYGGIIRKISTSDKNGKFENIVLSLDTIQDYEDRSPYFSAIIGRNAGRISKASFILEGKNYNLAKNSGENNLHGGINNFSHKIWNVQEIFGENYIGLELSLKSPHLDEGFPGNVEVKVRYILKENQLTLDYYGTSDRTTYLNLTNHAYFNLSGDFKRDITDEFLKLDCDKFITVDKDTLPVKIESVDKTPFDLRESTLLKNSLLSNNPQIKIVNQGFDHPFIFSKKSPIPIKLEDKLSGRILEITTDQPAVVIYSGNYLHEVGNLSNGIPCKKYMGICFETQNYADTLRFLPDRAFLTTPEKPYIQKTTYIFKTIK